MKQKKLQLWLPLLLSVIMVAGMTIGYQIRKETAGPDSFLNNSQNTATSQVLNIINKMYVDNVNTDSLQTYTINNLLSRLDPHSVYIPADKLSLMNDESKGTFTGIGIGFELINDSVYITNITQGSPAFTAGIQAGDKFLSLNDSLQLSGPNKSNEGVVNLLRQLNSPIKIKIDRNGKIIETKVNKTLLPIPSVDAAYMLDAKTAYIRLNKFSETTYREFMLSLEMLKRKGMQQLLIDLRGNSGGVMTT
ncbi:MAG TPA: S41 family peptidase, partial [Arachidicoccus sp.]